MGLFTPSHFIMLTLFVVVAAWLVRRGRFLAKTRFPRCAGWFIVVTFTLGQLFYLLWSGFDVHVGLPLQLCDLAWLVAGLALLMPGWRIQTWLYYWGLTLSLQGILTPSTLEHPFPHPRFIVFWLCHLSIVWAALFVTFGMGYRPDWRRFRFAFGTTAIWAGVVFLFNKVTASNYMFLNAKPPGPSLLDFFGPWPSYLLVEAAVVALLWSAITLPWTWRKS